MGGGGSSFEVGVASSKDSNPLKRNTNSPGSASQQIGHGMFLHSSEADGGGMGFLDLLDFMRKYQILLEFV